MNTAKPKILIAIETEMMIWLKRYLKCILIIIGKFRPKIN